MQGLAQGGIRQSHPPLEAQAASPDTTHTNKTHADRHGGALQASPPVTVDFAMRRDGLLETGAPTPRRAASVSPGSPPIQPNR